MTEPATGQVVAGYEYSGYGVPTQVQGTLKQPYGYIGREYDAESGLYHYRARAYDPETGTFVQMDPIGFASGTENLTQYSFSNPFNLDDPTGWSTNEDLVLVGVGAADAAGTVAVVDAGTTTLAAQIGRFLNAAGRILIDGRDLGLLSTTYPSGPNGDCKPEQHSKLQSRVDRAKDVVGKLGGCTADMNLVDKAIRYAAWTELGNARTKINMICYQGGDPTHRDQVIVAFEKASECF